MLRRIDSLILDRVFQPVIDRTGWKPVTVARNVATLFSMAAVVNAFFYGWIPMAILAVFSGLLLLVIYRLGDRLSMLMASGFQRAWPILWTVICLLWMDFKVPYEQEQFLARQVVYVAFCYFAICRQPPPRKKREDVKGGRLSFGGAA